MGQPELPASAFDLRKKKNISHGWWHCLEREGPSVGDKVIMKTLHPGGGAY